MTRFLFLVVSGLLTGLLIGYCAHADWFAGTDEGHAQPAVTVFGEAGPAYLRVAPDQPTLGRLIVIMSQMIQQTKSCELDLLGPLVPCPCERPEGAFVVCGCP